MPRSFTWKQLFWTAIVLTVVGLVASGQLTWLVYSIGGQEAINNVVLQWAQVVLGQVAFQLGLALIAMLLVVRAIGGRLGANVAEAPAPAPRALARIFWIGVATLVVGLVVQSSVLAWQWDLSGATDVGRGLARDALWLFGAPLEAVAVPLGTLLVAGSVVARSFIGRSGTVETEPRVPSAERF